MMNSLTLDKAMELYEILGAHIPEVEDENVDALEFIGKIIKRINDSNNHKDYTLSVEVMSGKSWEEIKQLNSDEVLDLFIDGLVNNKIISLKIFCESVGLDYA
jgi:hypothetical protein